MTETPHDLSRRLLEARDRGGRVADVAGLLTRAATWLAQWPTESPGLSLGCQGCGEPLRQPEGRGRPRKWCGRGRCEAGRKAEKSTVGA